jgi:RNA polymerase sigma-70 factor (ECF subfamily)
VTRAQAELPYRTGAYAALMRKYETLLYSVCLRLLRHPADAEDVAQDVMFKVFMALPKFEARSSFKTWMMRIARNTCFTWQKKRHHREEIGDEDIDQTATGADADKPHDAIYVNQLLEALAAGDREVLTLRYVADLSLQEIADVCDLSLSAAKMRLYRATEKIQALAADDSIAPKSKT